MTFKGRPKKSETEKGSDTNSNSSNNFNPEEKILELIQDVPTLENIRNGNKKQVVEEKKPDVLDQVAKEKGNNWLSQQVDRLNSENEILRKDLQKLKHDYDLLMVGSEVQPENFNETEILKNNIRTFYREIENNFKGRNPEKTTYTFMKLEILLIKMLNLFPFLEQ